MNWKGIVAAVLVMLFLIAFAAMMLFPPAPNGGPDHNLELVLTDVNSSQPLIGVMVVIYDPSKPTFFESGLTDEDGKIFLIVPSGPYSVIINASGYEAGDTKFVVSEDGTKVVTIQVVKIPICEEDWTCTNWSECSGNVQTRTCTDINECGTEKSKPSEIQGCSSVECTADSECKDNNSCTLDWCISGRCVNREITSCTSGDNCCPESCDYTNDFDCPASDQCQNDSDCDDEDPSTTDVCVGTPKVCRNRLITQCINGDGYCPTGCHKGVDNDCESVFCYSNDDCDDDNDCTDEICSAGMCIRTNVADGTDCGSNKICCSGECEEGSSC